MNIFDLIKLSLFLRRCNLCGEVIEINSPKACCDYCEKAQRICGKEFNNAVSYKAVVAPFAYEDSIREGIQKYKYSGFKNLSSAYADEMVATVKKEYGNISFDYVSYVPITKKIKRKRGYNQCKLLAQKISNQLKIPCCELLIKVKNTKNQKGLNRKDRMANLKNAFEIASTNVKGKTILLVDDVKTTGSTLNECAKVLKKNKAKDVYAVTIAMTLEKIK